MFLFCCVRHCGPSARSRCGGRCHDMCRKVQDSGQLADAAFAGRPTTGSSINQPFCSDLRSAGAARLSLPLHCPPLVFVPPWRRHGELRPLVPARGASRPRSACSCLAPVIPEARKYPWAPLLFTLFLVPVVLGGRARRYGGGVTVWVPIGDWSSASPETAPIIPRMRVGGATNSNFRPPTLV